MAGSLLILLDDIAAVLDDVATMTKVAVRKTAGVLGDDLALNAKQLTGIAGRRELPVVWAVARGSAVNKAILVPAAMAIDWLAPWLVGPLLVVGGLYLCYEGAEKILHRVGPGGAPGSAGTADDEATRIAGAIRTDFILSAEIIVITLGVVAASPAVTQFAVLATVAIAMTVGVYGLVAAIVKLDDLGTLLAARPGAASRRIGLGIVAAAPVLVRLLSVAGTAAMFLVGGGIIVHAVPAAHEAVHAAVGAVTGHAEDAHGWTVSLATAAAEGIFGLVAGFVTVAVAKMVGRLIGANERAGHP